MARQLDDLCQDLVKKIALDLRVIDGDDVVRGNVVRSGGEESDKVAAGAVGVISLGGSSSSGRSCGSGIEMGGGAWRLCLADLESKVSFRFDEREKIFELPNGHFRLFSSSAPFLALLDDLEVVVQDSRDNRDHVCLDYSRSYSLRPSYANIDNTLKS